MKKILVIEDNEPNIYLISEYIKNLADTLFRTYEVTDKITLAIAVQEDVTLSIEIDRQGGSTFKISFNK